MELSPGFILFLINMFSKTGVDDPNNVLILNIIYLILKDLRKYILETLFFE